jgi:DnaJ-class molecular chaperone
MNYKKACKHLGIEETGPLTKEILKKHYRMNALRYHPDKNNTPEACSRFQEIHASYDFLLKTID